MIKSAKRPLKLPANSPKVRADNKALWNEARSPEAADFFTFGYEGRKTDELISVIKSAGVKSVVDIRFNPVSMYRPELSKGNFQRLVESENIEYFHMREWGVPREIRAKAVDTGTRETIWDWYDAAVVEPFFDKNMHIFLNQAHPVAMMCTECDPTECHRHRLFMALERHGLRGYDL